MHWLDRILEPVVQLPHDRTRRLLTALALTIGMDSLAIMKDVCRLNDEEAVEVLAWVSKVLFEAGLDEAKG
jgi:hypothetical protein